MGFKIKSISHPNAFEKEAFSNKEIISG